MPVWTNTTTRAALPSPAGNQSVTRAAFLEFFNDVDLKGAWLGVANTFTQTQTIGTGNLVLTAGNVVLNAAASKIIPGATSLSLRNNADGADNVLITNAGVMTVRAGFVLTAGDATVTAGRLLLSAAAAKIVPGATSLSIRDNIDANDNLIVLNNGNVTARGALDGASIPKLDTHVAAADPHPVYLTQTEGDGRYATLAGSGMTQTQGDLRYLQLTGGTLSGNLTFSGATATIVPGATSFALRNNANNANNLILTDAGAATIRAGLTITAGGALVSSGDLTLTTGRLVVSNAVGKLVPGGTSFSLRNAADNADNLIQTDAGNTTIRGTLVTNGGDLAGIASAPGPGLLRVGTTGTDTNGLGVGYLQFQRPDYASNQIMGGIRVVTNGASSGSRGGDLEILSKPDNNAALVGLTLAGATGNVTLNRGSLVFSTAASRIVPGGTSLSLRNNADSNDNLLISNAGDVTVRGNLTVSGTSLVLSAAVSEIIPGSTSFSVRNNADNADNLLVTNAGVVTARTGLVVSGGGAAITGNSTITGTLSGLTGLTVASGGMSVTGNSTIAGTLGSITTLTAVSLAISGGIGVSALGVVLSAGDPTTQRFHAVSNIGSVTSGYQLLTLSRTTPASHNQWLSFQNGVSTGDFLIGRYANSDDLVFSVWNGSTHTERARLTTGGTFSAASLALNDGSNGLIQAGGSAGDLYLRPKAGANVRMDSGNLITSGAIVSNGNIQMGGAGRIITLVVGDAIYFAADKYVGATAGASAGVMQYYSGALTTETHQFSTGGQTIEIGVNAVRALSAGFTPLGDTAHPWTVVYASNGVIQPSRLSTKSVLSDFEPGHALAVARSAKRIIRFNYLQPKYGNVIGTDDEAWPVREQWQEPDTAFEHVGFDADEVHPDLLVAPGEVNPQNTATIALRAAVDVDDARISDRAELLALIEQLQADVAELKRARNN